MPGKRAVTRRPRAVSVKSTVLLAPGSQDSRLHTEIYLIMTNAWLELSSLIEIDLGGLGGLYMKYFSRITVRGLVVWWWRPAFRTKGDHGSRLIDSPCLFGSSVCGLRQPFPLNQGQTWTSEKGSLLVPALDQHYSLYSNSMSRC